MGTDTRVVIHIVQGSHGRQAKPKVRLSFYAWTKPNKRNNDGWTGKSWTNWFGNVWLNFFYYFLNCSILCRHMFTYFLACPWVYLCNIIVTKVLYSLQVACAGIFFTLLWQKWQEPPCFIVKMTNFFILFFCFGA